MNVLFSQHIFVKYLNTKFHYSPFAVSRIVPYERTDRQTDRHDIANSRFSQVCVCALKLYINIYEIGQGAPWNQVPLNRHQKSSNQTKKETLKLNRTQSDAARSKTTKKFYAHFTCWKYADKNSTTFS